MQNTPAELCERVFYCAIISRLFDDLHRAVVIAMVAVLMMQTTVYQVIHMVAVWHGFVSAACAVAVFAASVHHNARRGRGADAHRAGNPHGRHVGWRCVRSLRRGRGCGLRVFDNRSFLYAPV